MGDFAFDTPVHWPAKADLLRKSSRGWLHSERTGALHDNARATVEALHIDAYLMLTQQSGERFIPRLEFLANQGNGHAALTLGLIYTDTLGPRRDTAAAFRWFRKAAHARNPDGLYRLSYHAHTSAQGDESSRAQTLLRGAVAYGHPAAAYTLGAPLVHSLDPAERARGESLLHYAAKHGITSAMVALAESLAHHELDHTDQDFEHRAGLRRRWLEAAARRDHTGAMIAVAAELLNDETNTVQHPRAVDLLTRAVRRGDPDARLIRAKARWFGRGFSQNRAKALRAIIRLAKDRHPEAIRFLALIASDFTAQAFHDEALAVLRVLVEQGDETARGHLGRLTIEGAGLTKDQQQGIALLKQAVRAGNFEALETLWDYSTDRGTRDDTLNDVRAYIERGSDQRIPVVMYIRAYILERQAEATESPTVRAELDKEIDNLLEYASFKGMHSAAFTLARRAYDQPTPLRDQSFIFRLRRHAARLGHPEGMHTYAWALRRGSGTQADPKAARAWFEKALNAGFARSAHELAEMVWNGEGGQPDPISAENLFSRAVQLGDVNAQTTHALLLINRGTPADLKHAHELLLEAAQTDSIPAMIELAVMHMRMQGGYNDLNFAEHWLTKAMRDEPHAQHLLAMLNIDLRGYPSAVHEGLKHLFEAADRGSSNSMTVLARFYDKGIYVAQSLAIADSYLERSAELGNLRACRWLAEKILSQAPNRDRDDRAVRLLSTGVDAGDADCAVKLADLYFSGRGVPRDLTRAFQLNLFAAEQGHIDAMLSVALSYTHGRGVPTNPDAAKEWLRKAAHAGSPQARKLLGLPEEPSQTISSR